jgi:hypothetical protein
MELPLITLFCDRYLPQKEAPGLLTTANENMGSSWLLSVILAACRVIWQPCLTICPMLSGFS